MYAFDDFRMQIPSTTSQSGLNVGQLTKLNAKVLIDMTLYNLYCTSITVFNQVISDMIWPYQTLYAYLALYVTMTYLA